MSFPFDKSKMPTRILVKKGLGKAKMFIEDRSIRGKKITNVKEVCQMAMQKKAIVYRGARITAAFVANFQAMFLQREIDAKLIYHYKKKRK